MLMLLAGILFGCLLSSCLSDIERQEFYRRHLLVTWLLGLLHYGEMGDVEMVNELLEMIEKLGVDKETLMNADKLEKLLREQLEKVREYEENIG